MAGTGTSRTDWIRSHDEGAPWPGRGHLLPTSRRAELRDLLVQVVELSGRTDLWDPDAVVDYAAAHDVLQTGWEIGLGAIEAADAGAERPRAGALAGIIDLLRALKAFDDRLRDERLQQRDTAFERAREALAQLRRVDSTVMLVEKAAIAVCSLGFDRAIVSRVEQDRWVPETVYVGRDVKWAEEILAAGRDANLLLDDSLLETEMVTRGIALLVSDVQDRPEVNRQIAEASMSRSYVAAPIIAHGSVIGFLHADCYYQRRNLDEIDRDILAVFGEGLGYALARTAVLDGLEGVRGDLDRLASGVTSAVPSADWSTWRPRAEGSAARRSVGFLETLQWSDDRSESKLTPREIEVLRYVAEGDTNSRIARRLVVTEGTVKTHVKHILRKLGAANRAEAASRWWQVERSAHGTSRNEE